ncbi:Uncharacterized protein T11_18269 [Trichinella zimbabwensis]|uniref:PiggyBac transposable element-derived protein domain-containing protein n=1 Tax=Trichinella zimbabwensis TaxID=268475 RepID=A0A0V1HIU8_9BILA|nr:Uncharacterized protein T11_18269 [Trichinella zimbabwensis]
MMANNYSVRRNRYGRLYFYQYEECRQGKVKTRTTRCKTKEKTYVRFLKKPHSALPRYRMFWAHSSRVDSVTDCMNRNKFEALLRFLHFNDSDKAIMDRNHPEYDRFFKVRPLLDNISQSCLQETACQLQCVDEHIIPFKGRCKMKSNRLRGCPVMPLNELKQRDRGTYECEYARDNMQKIALCHGNVCGKCYSCQEDREKELEAPLFSWNTPSKPWARIHLDFTSSHQEMPWLIEIDAYSKWPEVEMMKMITTKALTEKLRE